MAPAKSNLPVINQLIRKVSLVAITLQVRVFARLLLFCDGFI
jgi:hypothetical protein